MLNKILDKYYGSGIGNNIIIKKTYKMIKRYFLKDKIVVFNYKYKNENISFKMKVNPKYSNVDEIIYFEKEYATKIKKLLLKNLKEKDLFIDIGANIGAISLLASKIVKKVYSFEPVPFTYKRLLEQIKLNNSKNIIVVKKGLGSKKEKIPFYVNKYDQGLSSVMPKKNYKKMFLEITTLDDFFKNKIEKINFIKIDVEGYEFETLKGMKKTIEKNHPKIILEYSPIFYKKIYGKKWYDIIKKQLDFLKKQKYSFYLIKEDSVEKITSEDFFKNTIQEDIFIK